MTDSSPNGQIVADPYTDMLAPQSETWVRGFRLEPAEPRITALVLTGYRDLLNWAIEAKRPEDIARYQRTILDLGGQP